MGREGNEHTTITRKSFKSKQSLRLQIYNSWKLMRHQSNKLLTTRSSIQLEELCSLATTKNQYMETRLFILMDLLTFYIKDILMC